MRQVGVRRVGDRIDLQGGDVRVEDVADTRIEEATDALVRVTRAAVCGTDLLPYDALPKVEAGLRMGHEFVGVVEEVGSDVTSIKRGNVVIAPFAFSDGSCDFCSEGLHTSCRNGGMWGVNGIDGGQAEAVRVPQAEGTLVAVPVAADDALMPSLLTLSDVFATGHHAAVSARVRPGASVAVIGDGAVGLCGVIAARRLGAERIILLGRHPGRTDLGRAFGATEVVAERGDEAEAQVRQLTDDDGVHCVLEAVGTQEALDTAVRIARPGGAVGRVGLPRSESTKVGTLAFHRNVAIGGGLTPARAYIEELLPEVLEGRLEPGRVFDLTVSLEDIPDAYRGMRDREAIKALVTP